MDSFVLVCGAYLEEFELSAYDCRKGAAKPRFVEICIAPGEAGSLTMVTFERKFKITVQARQIEFDERRWYAVLHCSVCPESLAAHPELEPFAHFKLEGYEVHHLRALGQTLQVDDLVTG
jgi:hypothetical protein